MIDFLEIRNAERVVIGIIDTASSIIWHSVYYGVGDFEIYIKATNQTMSLLQKGNYVTRQNNDEVGIIETINIVFTVQDGYMITASGRFAKSILDRRIIYKLSGTQNTPTILSGNVEIAVRQLVRDNAIDCSFDSRRNIPILGLAALKNLTPVIVDENGNAAQKQVSYQNLLEYTDGVLQEYGLSANVIYNDSNKKLLYAVNQGADRSTDNTDGNEPIVFSIEYDNLNSSNYLYDEKPLKNAALIGGAGEGLERFYSLLTGGKNGLQLREMFVDARSQNKEIRASELQAAYPSGTFDGYSFIVDDVSIAELVFDLTREYSLSTLQSKFPTGEVYDTYFMVSGVAYAIAVYGKDSTYTLTKRGYKAMLDVDGTDGTYIYTTEKYTEILNQQGQSSLKDNIINETFKGEINVSFGVWIFGVDYFLGDIVTVQDNFINKYVNTRITEATEVQDQNGYAVDVVFGD